MIKNIVNGRLIALAALLFASQPALAIGGCVNSPEAPTLILALLGGLAVLMPRIRDRLGLHRSRLTSRVSHFASSDQREIPA